MENYFDNVGKLIKENKTIEQFLKGQGYCIICYHDDPLDLENHHIGAKSNNILVVSLCRNCHGRISRKQRYWPEGWSTKNKPQPKKDAIFLIGIGDVFRMIGERMYYES